MWVLVFLFAKVPYDKEIYLRDLVKNEDICNGDNGPAKESVGRSPTRWIDNLKKVAGSCSRPRSRWKTLGETYVQQWTLMMPQSHIPREAFIRVPSPACSQGEVRRRLCYLLGVCKIYRKGSYSADATMPHQYKFASSAPYLYAFCLFCVYIRSVSSLG